MPDGNVILWRDSFDFTDDPTSGIQGMLNMVWVLRSGLANPRIAYLPIDPRVPGATVFSEALGGQHVAELDVHVGDAEFQCHVIDYGEGGLLGLQRAFVYMELGLPAPEPETPVAATAGAPVSVEPGAVRDALRSLAVPADLARSPLASGRASQARAASVRALLETGTRDAFGDADDERLLASVLTRGYLDPAPSHEAAATSSTSVVLRTSGASSRHPSGSPSTWRAPPCPRRR